MKNKIINAVIIFLSLAACGGCVYACCLYNTCYVLIPCYIAVSAIFLFFASLLHELGHMFFGIFAKIKVRLERLRPFSSSSVQIVPKTDKNLNRRIICTALGGLAVNFIFIALGLIALFVHAVPVYISLVLPASFYLFALNTLPLSFDKGKTDGLVILELAKNTDNAKVLLAVLTVQAQVLNGKPIEEVDEKLLFDLPQIQEDDSAFVSLAELRHEYFKAKGEEDKALLWKNRFEELKKEYL